MNEIQDLQKAFKKLADFYSIYIPFKHIYSGSVIGHFLGIPWNDVDTFLLDPLPEGHEWTSRGVNTTYGDFITSRYFLNGAPFNKANQEFNIIAPLESLMPLEIVSGFDFRHLNWYYDPQRDYLHLTEETLDFNKWRVLSVLNRSVFYSPLRKIKQSRRIQKYIDRGFTPDYEVKRYIDNT
jgi:hypothetical protein